MRERPLASRTRAHCDCSGATAGTAVGCVLVWLQSPLTSYLRPLLLRTVYKCGASISHSALEETQVEEWRFFENGAAPQGPVTGHRAKRALHGETGLSHDAREACIGIETYSKTVSDR